MNHAGREPSGNSGDSAFTATTGDRQRGTGGAWCLGDDHVTGVDIHLLARGVPMLFGAAAQQSSVCAQHESTDGRSESRGPGAGLPPTTMARHGPQPATDATASPVPSAASPATAPLGALLSYTCGNSMHLCNLMNNWYHFLWHCFFFFIKKKNYLMILLVNGIFFTF